MKRVKLAAGGITQAAIAGASLLVIAAAPASGRAQLLVSIVGESDGAMAAWAIGSGARILGPGPLPNSLIVRGDADLGWRAAHHGALLLAGPAGGCGGNPTI